MQALETVVIHCAFCGEAIEVVIDCSIPSQSYVEDCQVCCRPLVFTVEIPEHGALEVNVRFEDE